MSGSEAVYSSQTGKTTRWNSGNLGNNHHADSSGNVYRSSGASGGSGWQQHSSSGWSGASGDSSWADRESQARSGGADRFGNFSAAERS
jgi:hypothetical protein